MLRSLWIRIPALSGLGLLALLLGALGLNLGGCAIPKRTLSEQVALIAPHTDIRLPKAETPVPAVVMLHGCGGQRQVQEDYATAYLERGYAVMIIGSNAARDIGRFGAMSQVCTALRLSGQERAADIHAAIALAQANDAIDASRLALIGWSHGGWTILDALALAGRGDPPPALTGSAHGLDGVELAIVMYPYCGFAALNDGRARSPVPIRAILAGEDAIAPVGDCRADFDRAAQVGTDIEHEIWPDLTHAFDEPNAPPLDPRIRYDAEAAEQARTQTLIWLDAAFEPISDQG